MLKTSRKFLYYYYVRSVLPFDRVLSWKKEERKKEEMTHLNVAVRVRPLSEREINSNAIPIIEVAENIVAITNLKVPEQYAGDSRERVRRFSFDFCFDTSATQHDVFHVVNDVIGDAVKKKYHTCILAYGQSSSGKTHTMMGFNENLGLTPRLCEEVFSYVADVETEDDKAKVTISYLEIYNEKVNDLLRESHSEHNLTNLRVREHPAKGTYVQGLSEHIVTNSTNLLELLRIGNKKRRVSATSVNPQSSRSHSVVTLKCLGGVKITLVDLAGSERSSNHTKSTFLEGANINKSLVALGNVISSLADQSTRTPKGYKKRFVPYRDSVLTWLLKDTLGGNSQTLMIATISSSSTCYNETVNTLRFGHRAKQIVSVPIVNEDPRQRIIRELRIEVGRLKELLLCHQINPDIRPKPVLQITNTEHPIKQKPATTDASTNTDVHLAPIKTKQLLPYYLKTSIIDRLDQKSDDLNSQCFGDSTTITKPEDQLNLDRIQQFIDTFICSTLTNLETTNKIFNINQKNPIAKVWTVDQAASSTEKLIPVMDVTSNNGEKPLIKLRRTYSVCSDMDGQKPKMYGSHETLATSKGEKLRKAITATLRKKSIDKSTPALTKVEARVDSIRRNPIKPRSEIVAAVTERLYSKIKKKDASTETEEVTKENKGTMARLRLQDITQRAMRYYKRKHADTQTDQNSVVRVKDIGTDVEDLRIETAQVKSTTTSTEAQKTSTVGTYCNLNEGHLILTTTCGTQAGDEPIEPKDTKSATNLLSFTKYLRDKDTKDKIPNPIYTSSVNIHVSHNYINGTKSDSISGDSLDDQSTQNVNLATPDLLSNHNSLEATDNTEKLNFAMANDIPSETNDDLNEKFGESCQARPSIIPHLLGEAGVSISPAYAPQIHVLKQGDRVKPLRKQQTNVCQPNIVDVDDFYLANITEPTILKSIMKHPQCEYDSDLTDASETFENVTDAFNYKKVKFPEDHKLNSRMVDSMANFLKEASALMANLSIAAKKLDRRDKTSNTQVTLDDISDMVNKKCRRKYRKKKKTDASTSCQAMDEDIPENKFEILVKNSCDRLEQLSQTPLKTRTFLDESSLHRFPQPFSVNDWNDFASLQQEDSSLESNPTYSDYGSLPRRKVRHKSFLPPSEYLKQLTNMRKQIIDTSRDELLHDPPSGFD